MAGPDSAPEQQLLELLRRGDLRGAHQLLSAWLEQRPGDPALTMRLRQVEQALLAQAQQQVLAEPLKYAYAYLQAGRLPEALQLLRLELSKNPNNAQVRDLALYVARRIQEGQAQYGQATPPPGQPWPAAASGYGPPPGYPQSPNPYPPSPSVSGAYAPPGAGGFPAPSAYAQPPNPAPYYGGSAASSPAPANHFGASTSGNFAPSTSGNFAAPPPASSAPGLYGAAAMGGNSSAFGRRPGEALRAQKSWKSPEVREEVPAHWANRPAPPAIPAAPAPPEQDVRFDDEIEAQAEWKAETATQAEWASQRTSSTEWRPLDTLSKAAPEPEEDWVRKDPVSDWGSAPGDWGEQPGDWGGKAGSWGAPPPKRAPVSDALTWSAPLAAAQPSRLPAELSPSSESESAAPAAANWSRDPRVETRPAVLSASESKELAQRLRDKVERAPRETIDHAFEPSSRPSGGAASWFEPAAPATSLDDEGPGVDEMFSLRSIPPPKAPSAPVLAFDGDRSDPLDEPQQAQRRQSEPLSPDGFEFPAELLPAGNAAADTVLSFEAPPTAVVPVPAWAAPVDSPAWDAPDPSTDWVAPDDTVQATALESARPPAWDAPAESADWDAPLERSAYDDGAPDDIFGLAAPPSVEAPILFAEPAAPAPVLPFDAPAEAAWPPIGFDMAPEPSLPGFAAGPEPSLPGLAPDEDAVLPISGRLNSDLWGKAKTPAPVTQPELLAGPPTGSALVSAPPAPNPFEVAPLEMEHGLGGASLDSDIEPSTFEPEAEFEPGAFAAVQLPPESSGDIHVIADDAGDAMGLASMDLPARTAPDRPQREHPAPVLPVDWTGWDETKRLEPKTTEAAVPPPALAAALPVSPTAVVAPPLAPPAPAAPPPAPLQPVVAKPRFEPQRPRFESSASWFDPPDRDSLPAVLTQPPGERTAERRGASAPPPTWEMPRSSPPISLGGSLAAAPPSPATGPDSGDLDDRVMQLNVLMDRVRSRRRIPSKLSLT